MSDRSSVGGDAITIQVISLHELQQKKDVLERAIKSTKDYIIDYLKRNYMKKHIVSYTDTKQIIATVCERTNTKIDEEGLLESLPKKAKKQICRTDYSVNVEGLKILLKERPDIKPLLLRVINIDRHVDQAKLVEALELGEIEFDKIKDFVHQNPTYYLKMQEKESKHAIDGEKEAEHDIN